MLATFKPSSYWGQAAPAAAPKTRIFQREKIIVTVLENQRPLFEITLCDPTFQECGWTETKRRSGIALVFRLYFIYPKNTYDKNPKIKQIKIILAAQINCVLSVPFWFNLKNTKHLNFSNQV